MLSSPVFTSIDCRPRMNERPFEIVEMKGSGHPDSLADGISEAVSILAEQVAIEHGVPPYIYADKVLVVPGTTFPQFGGGSVVVPMEIYVPYLSTVELVPERVKAAVYTFLELTLAAFDQSYADVHVLRRQPSEHSAETHYVFPAEFEDSGIAVAYAPYSSTETLVKRIAELLSEKRASGEYAAVGEDVKILAVRHLRSVEITIACAFVGRLIATMSDYLSLKSAMARDIAPLGTELELDLAIDVNPDDRPNMGSVYLTVTGTSAEHGDCGVTGRGNRWNGIITPLRPMSIEALSGKNKHNHPARLLTHVANKLSCEIHKQFSAHDVQVIIAGKVGNHIRDVEQVHIQVTGETGVSDIEISKCAQAWLDQFVKAETSSAFYAI